jgi:hypothetical protein
MMRLISLTAFVVLLSGAVAFAQEAQSVTRLIDQSIANAEQNAKAALAYTFREEYVATQTQDIGRRGWRAINGRSGAGIVGGDSASSTQYEVLFIKDVPYRRLVSVNHQPLSHQAAAEVSKRYDAMVTAIHAMSDEERLKMAKGGNSLMVDPKQLTSTYACNIVGHAKVQRRPATVVECRPRHDLPVGKDGAPQPVSTDIKLWIDDEQPFFARTRAVLNRTIDENQRLTTVTIQWRLIDGVWHQTSTEVNWVGPEDSGIHGKVVDTFSNFKRFRAEAKIVP